MFIRLTDLPHDGRHFEANWPACTLSMDKGGELRSQNASAQVHVVPEGQGHRLTGTAEVEGVVTCARCLVSVSWQGSLPLSVLALNQSRVDQDVGDHRMPMDEVDHLYYLEDGIELWDVVEGAWRLALPQRILCNEECKGLCVSCGTNKNESTCGCESQVPNDENRKALAGLLEQMKENHHG